MKITLSFFLLLITLIISVKCESLESLQTIEQKKPGETLSLSYRGSGFNFQNYNMHWIRQQANKPLVWMGFIYYDASGTGYSKSFEGRTEITRDNSNSMVYLKLSGVTTEDTSVYYCARHGDNSFDYWGKGTMVTVTTAGPSKLVGPFPLWQCGSSGDGSVTLGCITHGLSTATGNSYTWKDASGSALTEVVQYPSVQSDGGYTLVSQARVRAADWDSGKSFICQYQDKSIPMKKPDVQQLNASVLLTTPSKKELDSGTASFVCLASNFSPKVYSFKWTHGTDDLTGNVKETILNKEKNNYTAISVLEIDAKDWTGKTDPIQCKFSQKNMAVTKEALYVHGEIVTVPEIEIIPPSPTDMLIKGGGELVCEVVSTSGELKNITWKIGNRNIPSRMEGTLNKDSTIKCITKISFSEWSNGSKFTCEVTHSAFTQGFQTKDYQRQNGQKKSPKAYLLPPPERDSSDNVTLTCFAKDFNPKEVAVSWLVNDKLRPDLEHYTTSAIDRDGQFSVYSQLIFTKTEWESGAVVTCRVYHESIKDSLCFISRSITSQSSPATLVNLNLTVPQTCSRR